MQPFAGAGPPPAWHLAREALAVIIRFAGQAPRRFRPLSSNASCHGPIARSITSLESMAAAGSLPQELAPIRQKALAALAEVPPAGSPSSDAESTALMLSARTDGGRSLPEYYLVYFLLVDLLGYRDLGQWEKVAWIVPVRYQGRLYSIEHRKFGVGVFAPNHASGARRSTKPSAQAESDACAIASAINKAVSLAEPYFEWRAAQAASTSNVNVVNTSDGLFSRYLYFRDRYRSLSEEAEARKHERRTVKSALPDGAEVTSGASPAYLLRREANWNAQAAIDAFFSWTEHSFIHLAILQGRICKGDAVAALAESDWKAKFKAAMNLADQESKRHYDALLDLRAQIRNFMAHGAFGKRGEAFSFHSGAGAVPVLLTQSQRHRYALTGKPAFNEDAAIREIDEFVEHLWSGARAPARIHIFSDLPSILTYAGDGTYASAMKSEQDMPEFVEYQTHLADRSADMDW